MAAVSADALIAGASLSGTTTRRIRRALAAVFAGPVCKDVVSRAWRKVKGDRDAWNARSLGEEPIVRLILDGTVVRVRPDKRATSISLQWRSACGQVLCDPEWAVKAKPAGARGSTISLSADRGPRAGHRRRRAGLEKALAAPWPDAPVQRCTLHKHRNLLPHAPERGTTKSPTTMGT